MGRGRGAAVSGAGGREEAGIEEILPEPVPGGPVVSAGYGVDRPAGECGGQQAVPAYKAVLASEPQMDRQRAAARPGDVTPHAPLLVVRGRLAGTPGVEAAGALDLGGDQVAAQVGREQAQPGELIRVLRRVAQRQVAAERDPAEPHGDTLRARGHDDRVAQLLKRGAVGGVPQFGRHEREIEPQAPGADRGGEALALKVGRRRIRGRQHDDADRRDGAGRGGGAQHLHQARPAAAGRARRPENQSASSVPGATVEPRSASTGTRENASTPKAITVAALATPSEARVRGTEPSYGRALLRSKNSA